jgi:riboflavin synthase
MFAGIVEGRGRVVEVRPAAGADRRLVIDVSALARRPRRGDSVSVAGVCLTVAAIQGRRAAFDVVGETIRRSTLGGLEPGDEANLEGALRFGDAVGGHQVSGHVDGVGTVRTLERRRDETWLTIAAPNAVLSTLVPKGFVAVDGASLTVAALSRGGFSVALIPTTLEVTTLGRAAKGTLVNLEGDALGKHVVKWIMDRGRTRPSSGRSRRSPSLRPNRFRLSTGVPVPLGLDVTAGTVPDAGTVPTRTP